ncbi:MAG: hypothetical protein A3K19_01045 [Lentisphaerae bacterium RIFOXYB12_FULL_65_16]|nr:MAG: hypothetical protein A3K18_04940 [Lentisphaerae bacterium RIFOXYA12_64_32]OGV93746.1 MAG: hypothetical protein A3K19_01045 [Lentisphaerae bacterium RIFOXYB12_FULL_65_16]
MRVGSGTILVVDDDAAVRKLLLRLLATCHYDVLEAGSAVEALRIIQSEPDRVDVLLADVRMPEMDGIELLNRVRDINPNIIAVVITGFASSETTVSAMRAGAYDLVAKPFNIHELKIILGRAVGTRYLVRQLAAYHLHTEELLREKTKALHDVVDRLRASYFRTMEAIVRLLDIHETSTAAHSRRVSEVTVLLASRMGLHSPAELEVIRFGALLHDIGKLGVPDAIINKPAALTDSEREVVRAHPELGYQMLRSIPGMEDIAQMVYSHHERYDGTGYPRGLRGDQTCMGARIFAVVDAYDALRHDRCYRTAQTPEKVLCEIKAGRGTQFDPAVVDAFLEHFQELEVTCLREEGTWEAGVRPVN